MGATRRSRIFCSNFNVLVMQYYININQKALSQYENLDLIDGAILDFIKNLSVSPTSNKLFYNDKYYVWVSPAIIKEKLPKIGIKSRQGIFNRVDKLINHNLLERHPDNQKLNRTYLGLGDEYDTFIYSGKGCQPELTRGNQIEKGVNETLQHVSTTVDTDTINYNTVTNTVREFEKFKKIYPQTRCTFDTAKQILAKQKIKIEDVVHLFEPAIKKEIATRAAYTEKGEFFASPAMMTTWLNQKRWQNEFADIESPKKMNLKW